MKNLSTEGLGAGARARGVLLHTSSLPSPYGIGDFGPPAYRFVDFLSDCGQRYWQVLPLNPTDGIFGNSPYSSVSAFALDPLFISPDLLVQNGWLKESDLKAVAHFQEGQTDYAAVRKDKGLIFEQAFQNFKRDRVHSSRYEKFCSDQRGWLEDFAMFSILKKYFSGKVWSNWDEDARLRKKNALEAIKRKLIDDFEKTKFLQYAGFQQWSELKDYCEQINIQLIGDMPIYVNYDSAEVWSHPQFFKLNSAGEPSVVAGVPPDYFSRTGQRWGNPIYDWENLKKTGYTWWLRRMAHNLKMFDIVRIDHFRGFVAFWEIPSQEKTAVSGSWIPAPYEGFWKCVTQKFPGMPFIAEDLGVITPEVASARMRFGLPGMKVLLFAFDGDLKTHPYLPENHTEDCVVYTGTHDNNTVKGWFLDDMGEHSRKNLFEYWGRPVTADEISWLFIKLAMMSRARTAILPMQDILALGSEARMNRPATTKGNWRWRLRPETMTEDLRKRLLEITRAAQRK